MADVSDGRPATTARRSHLSPVATCRQTVEALLSPLPPLGSGWLPFSCSHLSPVATCRQTVEAFLAPHHRLAADGYEEPVATVRP